MALESVILDVDGTLVLSNDAHAQAWVEAFAAYGYKLPFEKIRPLIGMGGDQVIPRLVPELNDKEGTGKQIADRRKELILTKFGSQLAAANGARELVQKMQAAGLHLIVASSSSPQEMEILLKVAGVEDLIQEFTTSSDAEASKPEPDIVEAAISKAHLEPDKTVMIGDAPYDIELAQRSRRSYLRRNVEAAGKVGIGVIALRCGGFSDEQLAGALAIYNDPADLLDHYAQSLLAS